MKHIIYSIFKQVIIRKCFIYLFRRKKQEDSILQQIWRVHLDDIEIEKSKGRLRSKVLTYLLQADIAFVLI